MQMKILNLVCFGFREESDTTCYSQHNKFKALFLVSLTHHQNNMHPTKYKLEWLNYSVSIASIFLKHLESDSLSIKYLSSLVAIISCMVNECPPRLLCVENKTLKMMKSLTAIKTLGITKKHFTWGELRNSQDLS